MTRSRPRSRHSLALALVAFALASALCLVLAADVTIDAVTLLLPSHACSARLKPVSRVVRAQGGCFLWHTSSPHVVSVTPLVEATADEPAARCEVAGVVGATAAIITVVHDDFANSNTNAAAAAASAAAAGGAAAASTASASASASNNKGRQSAWVWAEDIRTSRRAECEVFVDSIAALAIGTSTRRINIGDAESLDLLAYDEHGDLFTTLEGVPFVWTSSAERVARKLTFAEAAIEVSPLRSQMEQLGFSTDRLPIQGALPGRVTLSARLDCPTPAPVETAVDMLVTEPLGVYPTLVRVCPASDVAIHVYSRQHKSHLPLGGAKPAHAGALAGSPAALAAAAAAAAASASASTTTASATAAAAMGGLEWSLLPAEVSSLSRVIAMPNAQYVISFHIDIFAQMLHLCCFIMSHGTCWLA